MPCHFHRCLVAGDHQLLAALVQGVEDMEEHVLRFLLAGEELHIVDDQHVHHLVELREVAHGVVLHRLDELLGELLRRYVEDRLVRWFFLISMPMAWPGASCPSRRHRRSTTD
jgi:hypothetical protein